MPLVTAEKLINADCVIRAMIWASSQRGLSDSGRTPENHGRDSVLLDHTAQHPALSQQMLLPHIFFYCFRPQSGGQGLAHQIVKNACLFHSRCLIILPNYQNNSSQFIVPYT